ncbi:winged helix-turn-helix transcriptional regulator [Streptomyces flavofungini]|uniref:Helix-turn-helix transcriptional regulator n=1 Tax=Streptomyces flavofungini TaxID=68200 RepID=A0ABS0X3F3_9ACTN|nr:helix-turn-helix domain-containing protein [Streptomyces flavofungini]MBJ3807716.1 helix-turn-helix transcriptional regulator [Streptomyces flavofungini]GHC63756.1 cinnamoyl ester hydrolase [Streptomyces flavofungini]
MTAQSRFTPPTEAAGHRHDIYGLLCPGREIFELLANKWAGLAITALEDGPRRFGELRSRLEGVSPKVLTRTLRRLEEYGLVRRTVFAEVPPRVEYELTPLGRGALEPLAHLRTWIRTNTHRFGPRPG